MLQSLAAVCCWWVQDWALLLQAARDNRTTKKFISGQTQTRLLYQLANASDLSTRYDAVLERRCFCSSRLLTAVGGAVVAESEGSGAM